MHIGLPKRRFVSIPMSVIIYMAWCNLYSKKLRSFLTILGVIIGIGAIFFLLSLGLGLQKLVTDQVIGNQSVKSIDVSSPNSRIIKLDKENKERIANLANVDTLGSTYSFAGSLSFNNSEIDTIVYGVDKPFQDLSNLSLSEGRLLNPDDSQSLFLNSAALEAIGVQDKKGVIGKDIRLTIPIRSDSETKELKETFTIVGIIDSGAGSEVFIPGSIFEKNGVTAYSQIKLLSKSNEAIPDLRKQIESLGFETTSPSDTIDQINQIFQYFNVILVGFGAIGMIVAVLGMFNTLTISLLERTREIGLMVALGGRHKDMRKLFVIEAVLLSLIGSSIGIGLAILVGNILNLLMNNLANNRGVVESFSLFSAPAWLIASLVGFMVLIGLLVVYIPARRAQKINPIDALRRE